MLPAEGWLHGLKRWSQLAGGGRRPDQSPRAVKMAGLPLWISRPLAATAAPGSEGGRGTLSERAE